MMAAEPLRCWAPSAPAKSSSPIAPTTATRSATPSPGKEPANIKPLARRVDKLAFSPFLYRYRNRVERFFNKLKHFRAVATRYEKHASNYLALIKLAATRIWLRAYELVTVRKHVMEHAQEHFRSACSSLLIAVGSP